MRSVALAAIADWFVEQQMPSLVTPRADLVLPEREAIRHDRDIANRRAKPSGGDQGKSAQLLRRPQRRLPQQWITRIADDADAADASVGQHLDGNSDKALLSATARLRGVLWNRQTVMKKFARQTGRGGVTGVFALGPSDALLLSARLGCIAPHSDRMRDRRSAALLLTCWNS